MVERIAGARPPTCPWQAFSNPVVAGVLDLYRASGGENLASVWHLNPPAHLWDGLQHYAYAVAKIREHHEELADKRRGR